MTHRPLHVLSAAAIAALLVAIVWTAGTGEPALRAAQAQQADPASLLRAPWGEPDVQGIWSVELLVPLERPAGVTTEFYTEEQQAELGRQRAEMSVFGNHVRAERGSEADVAGAYNAVFRSQRPIGRRTGMVIDPPDGRVPPMTPEAQARQAEIREYELALMQNTAVCRDGLTQASLTAPAVVARAHRPRTAPTADRRGHPSGASPSRRFAIAAPRPPARRPSPRRYRFAVAPRRFPPACSRALIGRARMLGAAPLVVFPLAFQTHAGRSCFRSSLSWRTVGRFASLGDLGPQRHDDPVLALVLQCPGAQPRLIYFSRSTALPL